MPWLLPACDFDNFYGGRITADAQPWFRYLAYNADRFPVQPPQEWLDRVLTREPEIDPTRAKLVAFIEHLDAGIGRCSLLTEHVDLNDLVDHRSDLLPAGCGGPAVAGAGIFDDES